MSVVNSIYQGSASYGRFIAIVCAVIVTLFSIILILFGIKYVNSVDLYNKNTLSTITGKNCSQENKKNNQESCLYTVSYFDEDGVKIENVTFTSVSHFPLNSQVSISYNSSNKTEIRLTSENTKGTGYGMVFFGFIILAFAWGWVWVTRTYDFAASASGFSSAFNLFKN